MILQMVLSSATMPPKEEVATIKEHQSREAFLYSKKWLRDFWKTEKQAIFLERVLNDRPAELPLISTTSSPSLAIVLVDIAAMNFNTTAPLHMAAEMLYAGTDFTSLNWFEQKWAAWYMAFGDPAIATGIMSFALHEVRFSCSLIY